MGNSARLKPSISIVFVWISSLKTCVFEKQLFQSACFENVNFKAIVEHLVNPTKIL